MVDGTLTCGECHKMCQSDHLTLEWVWDKKKLSMFGKFGKK